MAKSKKRRKALVFSVIAVALMGLTAVVILKKRDIVITVQTEKVTRRNLTEIVVANGKIQPVLQVKISAEVSGEIIALPVKEGQQVSKGDLLVKIKPEFYIAATNQANASYKSALASKTMAQANLRKCEADFKRNQDLVRQKLISDSAFDEVQAAFDVAEAQLDSAVHQVDVAQAAVDSATDSLQKTTIVAPLAGTISKLNSRLGERVLGTVQNVGTEIMTIADLNEMETRVDIGENDVVRIAPGQKARLEVDAFKKRKFNGTVTEIANSSKDAGQMSSGSSQEATKFEVRSPCRSPASPPGRQRKRRRRRTPRSPPWLTRPGLTHRRPAPTRWRRNPSPRWPRPMRWQSAQMLSQPTGPTSPSPTRSQRKRSSRWRWCSCWKAIMPRWRR
jgi:HlyD family secretion protein